MYHDSLRDASFWQFLFTVEDVWPVLPRARGAPAGDACTGPIMRRTPGARTQAERGGAGQRLCHETLQGKALPLTAEVESRMARGRRICTDLFTPEDSMFNRFGFGRNWNLHGVR
jgi:hypothetical protein